MLLHYFKEEKLKFKVQYFENYAFAQLLVFVKCVLKWVLLSIESVKISKFDDGPKLHIYHF